VRHSAATIASIGEWDKTSLNRLVCLGERRRELVPAKGRSVLGNRDEELGDERV